MSGRASRTNRRKPRMRPSLDRLVAGHDTDAAVDLVEIRPFTPEQIHRSIPRAAIQRVQDVYRGALGAAARERRQHEADMPAHAHALVMPQAPSLRRSSTLRRAATTPISCAACASTVCAASRLVSALNQPPAQFAVVHETAHRGRDGAAGRDRPESRPFCSCAIRLGMPGNAVVMTGRPADIASSSTRGMPSPGPVGSTKRS